MIERQASIQAWIVDDTGFPKKGRHSVGVGRRYCGQIGKQDNCQVAVTLSVANTQASLPVGVSPLPAGSLDPGCRAAQQGRRARGDRLPDQARDRAGSDPSSLGRWSGARPRSGRCRIRDRYGLPYGADGFGLALQSGCSVLDEPAGPRIRTAAAQTLERTRAPTHPGTTEP